MGRLARSAATFTARAGLNTVVVDADKGMTRRAWVENHLGFPTGTSGIDLVDGGGRRPSVLGPLVDGTAEAIERTANGFSVRTADGQAFDSPSIILATGKSVDLAETAGVTTAAWTEPYIKSVIVVDADGVTSVPGTWAAGTAAGAQACTRSSWPVTVPA